MTNKSKRFIGFAVKRLTQLHEYSLMITKTLEGYPGSTSEELQSLPNCWLNCMAVFSVDRILTDAEKRGYVECKSKKGLLTYYPTKAGIRAYNKYIPQ